MPEVSSLKNIRTIDPICKFGVYRFTRVTDDDLTFETPCALCLTPYEGCQQVDKLRVWSVPQIDDNWTYTIDADLKDAIEAVLANKDISYDTPCFWTGTYMAESDGVTTDVDLSLEVTDDPPNPGRVVLTLIYTLTLSGSLSGTLAVTYQLSNVDPISDQTSSLTATGSVGDRTLDLDPDGEIVFPSALSLVVN